MFWQRGWLASGCLMVVLLGCGSGGVQEQRIEVKTANDPLFMPRSILQRYSEGQALGSEVSNFPNMVENVRKTDKARADLLEAGLKEIQDAPAAKRKVLAKELLAKLQPSMT